MRLFRFTVAAIAACLLAATPAFAFTQSVTASASGATSPVAIDLARSRCGVSLIVTISGTLTVDVQVTGDDVGVGTPLGNQFNYVISSNYNASTGHWNKHDTLQGLTASANGNLALPVTAVRLNVTAYTSGTATLAVVENDTCPK